MAAKKIEIIYDIDGKAIDVAIDKTLNLQQAAKVLTAELRRTKEGTDEFQLLSARLGDTQDGLKAVNAKSQDLLGSLSLLPGPIGLIGGELSSTVETLKTFSSFSLKDIQFQLKEVYNDVAQIAGNLGKATGITKLYTTLNNALAKSFVSVGVGEGVAAAGARAFAAALVATGIGALIVLLGSAASMLYEMASGEKAAADATRKLNGEIDSQNRLLAANSDSAKRRNAEVIAAMKVAGKTEKEIRDVQLNQSYKDYSDAYDAELQSRKTLNTNLQKASADDLKKMQDDLKSKEKATKDLYSSYKVMGLNNLATDKKEAEDAAKDKKEKVTNQNEQLIELEKQKQAELLVLSIKGEKERAQKEIEMARDKEIRDIQALKITKDKEHIRTKAIQEIRDTAAIKITQSNEKFDGEELKQKEDALNKIIELEVKAIEDEAVRSKVARYNQYLEEEKLLKSNLDKKLINQTQYDVAIKNAHTSMVNDNQKIDDDAAEVSRSKMIAALQDELQLLEAQQKSLQVGTQAYYDNAVAIENQAYAIKIANAKDNAKQIEAINLEHAQNLKNIDLAAFEAKKQIEIQKYAVVAGIGSSLQQLAGKNKALAIAGIVIEKAAAIGQIVANTQIANAKALAASPLTFGQPWVTINTIAGVLSGAATIAAATKAISEINGSGSEDSGNTSPQNLGRNYADGGLIGGERHAQGGTMIEAERGEAIMTRGAVTMFAPLLSMLNQAGGGTSFAPNAMVSSYDNPKPSNDTGMAPIIKTYVVSSDMTSSQEKNARLKNLSVL